LIKLATDIKEKHGGRCAGEVFAESLWYRLGALLSEAHPIPCASAQVRQAQLSSGPVYVFVLQDNSLLARLLDHSTASVRFLERMGTTPPQGILSRSDLIKNRRALCSKRRNC
jgi:hypothetical protein